MDDNYSSQGDYFRACRIKSGLKQRQLADELRITPQHISGIENGRSIPSKEILRRTKEIFLEAEGKVEFDVEKYELLAYFSNREPIIDSVEDLIQEISSYIKSKEGKIRLICGKSISFQSGEIAETAYEFLSENENNILEIYLVEHFDSLFSLSKKISIFDSKLGYLVREFPQASNFQNLTETVGKITKKEDKFYDHNQIVVKIIKLQQVLEAQLEISLPIVRFLQLFHPLTATILIDVKGVRVGIMYVESVESNSGENSVDSWVRMPYNVVAKSLELIEAINKEEFKNVFENDTKYTQPR